MPFKGRKGDALGFKALLVRLQHINSGFMSGLCLICAAWLLPGCCLAAASCHLFEKEEL